LPPALFPGPQLYPLIDTTVCGRAGIEPLALARDCLRGGARILQLRVKDDSSAAFLDLAEEIVAAAHGAGALVIVNDRADIARLSGADGVHVGQTDLPVEAVRAILGPGAVVGVSTHDRDQVDRALDSSATYVAVGPIFSTTTKETGYEARGLDLIRHAAGRGRPVVAIGGITLARAADVADAGAWGLAVISDLLADGDVAGRVRDFEARLAPHRIKV
jgi:thiamine-phosphate pyrophosphorylase